MRDGRVVSRKEWSVNYESILSLNLTFVKEKVLDVENIKS